MAERYALQGASARYQGLVRNAAIRQANKLELPFLAPLLPSNTLEQSCQTVQTVTLRLLSSRASGLALSLCWTGLEHTRRCSAGIPTCLTLQYLFVGRTSRLSFGRRSSRRAMVLGAFENGEASAVRCLRRLASIATTSGSLIQESCRITR